MHSRRYKLQIFLTLIIIIFITALGYRLFKQFQLNRKFTAECRALDKTHHIPGHIKLVTKRDVLKRKISIFLSSYDNVSIAEEEKLPTVTVYGLSKEHSLEEWKSYLMAPIIKKITIADIPQFDAESSISAEIVFYRETSNEAIAKYMINKNISNAVDYKENMTSNEFIIIVPEGKECEWVGRIRTQIDGVIEVTPENYPPLL